MYITVLDLSFLIISSLATPDLPKLQDHPAQGLELLFFVSKISTYHALNGHYEQSPSQSLVAWSCVVQS